MLRVHKYCGYIVLIITMLTMGILVPCHYVVLLLTMVIYMLLLNRWIKTKSLAVLKLIIISILLQNTMMGIGMHCFGVAGEDITLFSQVPTMFIYIAGAWIIILQLNNRYHYLFYLYITIILFNYFIGTNKSLVSLAYNTRNFTVFYMAFVMGAYFIDNKEKFNEFCEFVINVSIIAAIVGVIGCITNSQLYIWLGAAEVASVKMLNTGVHIVDGLPAYFLGDFFGTYYRRLASLFLEPVNFSSFMALSVILKATDLKNIKDLLIFVFLIVCNFLTFGKGGLLIDTVSIIALIMYHVLVNQLKLGKKGVFQIIKCGLIISVIILGIIYGTLYSYNMHFYAIKITMKALLKNPFGFGIGSVGNVNKAVVQSGTYLGAETGVLNFWCQLGIEGVIVFAMLIFRMSRDGFKTIVDKRHFVFALMPIILFLVFIFQENIFTTQVITGYMFVIGYISSKKQYQ